MTTFQWKSALYQLRSRIVSGELLAGTKLRASHLAAEMEFSRTPINEALIKLEAEGLLIRDKSGFSVRSFALDDVLDAIDLRGVLEATAVQRAAERGINDAEHQHLQKLLADLDQSIAEQDVVRYDQLNAAFHEYLVSLSNSAMLEAEVLRSYRFPFAGPSAFPTRDDDSDRFQASLIIGQRHHHLIVSAVVERASARAFSLVLEHARLAHQNVHAAIAAREQSPQLALVKYSR